MSQAFNLDELRVLSFDLGIEHEDLAGETRQAKIISLVDFVQRHDRLPDLLEVLAQTRPDVDWRKPNLLSTGDLRVREKILNNIQSTWIDGFLKDSLHNEVLELALSYRPEALSRSWSMAMKLPGQEHEPVPAERTIVEVFNDYGRSLLILGAPGSGKTITLLQLAQELIQEARDRPARPIPVILNLSSWAGERRPFEEWLVEEMLLQYQVAKRVTLEWVERNLLLYLFDGLDEVARGQQDECVTMLNAFQAKHTPDMVVCSRANDYERLSTRLNVSTAVLIQPLEDDEIQRYLEHAGQALDTTRSLIHSNPGLHALARSPLMLSVMTLAYQDLTRDELRPLNSMAARRRHLFHHYVERAFERRPLSESGGFSKEQALAWLGNLADGMTRRDSSAFYIERLQPGWLPANKLRSYKFLVGMAAGLVAGFFLGIILWLTGGVLAGLAPGLVVGLANAVIAGLIYGLFGGLGSALGGWASATLESKGIRFIIGGACAWLVCGLGAGPLVGLVLGARGGNPDGLSVGVIGSLLFGLIFGLIGGMTAYQSRIELVESVSFSRPGLRKLLKSIGQGTLIGLAAGIIFGLITGIVVWLGGDQLELLQDSLLLVSVAYSLVFGLFFGLGGALIGALMSVLQSRETEEILRPNQGMRNSLKNSVRLAALFGMSGVLIGSLLDNVLLDGEAFFLALGPAFGLIASLFYFGGIAVVHHFVLRFRLHRYNFLPWRLAPFLDEMVARIVLRRVGGGWVFVHRYLLEYFTEGGEDTEIGAS